MANPTTNYNFAMPQNSDLVKDLPADFEIFGQAVDTQMKTNADAAIAKSLVTTKGDLIAATGASTPARLGVGTNDQVLVADSTAATGMKWDTPSSGGMTLLSTTTLSGTSVTVSSISQSYKRLLIYIKKVYINSNAGYQLEMRINGDSTNNRYFSQGWNAGASYLDPNTSRIVLVDVLDDAANNSFISGIIEDYTSTDHHRTYLGWAYGQPANFPTNQIAFYSTFGFYNQTQAVTSLTFFPGGGSFSGGTVEIYGVK